MCPAKTKKFRLGYVSLSLSASAILFLSTSVRAFANDVAKGRSAFKQNLETMPTISIRDAQAAITAYNQGNELSEQGNVEAAIAAYKTAIALDPQNADAHYNLGYWLAHQGQLEAAEASYWQASQLAPFDAEIYYNLGLVLKQQSFFESAEVALQRALLLAPDNTNIREAIAALPNQQGPVSP